MLIQTEVDDIGDFCTGFMYIKSNEKTLQVFNPDNVQLHKMPSNWDDQVYLNEIRKLNIMNYKRLPLSLFPTGQYYYRNSNMSPYLIHFNWVIGHDKMLMMKRYNKWYI
jgi:hypothetical protein